MSFKTLPIPQRPFTCDEKKNEINVTYGIPSKNPEQGLILGWKRRIDLASAHACIVKLLEERQRRQPIGSKDRAATVLVDVSVLNAVIIVLVAATATELAS